MKESQTFEIDYKFATLNDYTNANRGNKYGGAAIKKQNTNAVSAQIVSPKKMEVPVIATFNWKYSTRHDFDNIAFAKKFVLDGLVDAGVLENDNQSWVKGFGGDAFEKVEKGSEGVVVILEPVDVQ